MKSKLLLLFITVALASPLVARADLVFKCQSGEEERPVTANLRFNEAASQGRIEADQWDGYPPTPLIYADLRLQETNRLQRIYVSTLNSHLGTKAKFVLASDFLQSDSFLARLEVIRNGTKESTSLDCKRF